MKHFKFAGIGCDDRTLTYMNLASKMPDHYKIVPGADPIKILLLD